MITHHRAVGRYAARSRSTLTPLEIVVGGPEREVREGSEIVVVERGERVFVGRNVHQRRVSGVPSGLPPGVSSLHLAEGGLLPPPPSDMRVCGPRGSSAGIYESTAAPPLRDGMVPSRTAPPTAELNAAPCSSASEGRWGGGSGGFGSPWCSSSFPWRSRGRRVSRG